MPFMLRKTNIIVSIKKTKNGLRGIVKFNALIKIALLAKTFVFQFVFALVINLLTVV